MDRLRSTIARAAGSARLRRGAAIVGIALGASLTGCDEVNQIGPESCDRSVETNMPLCYTLSAPGENNGGTLEGGVYMTSDWEGELLDFPGGRRYRIEHGLGVEPRFFQAYLSFSQHGTLDGTVAQAAGNQVEVNHVNCRTIDVINGSCVDYWLLFVAGAGDVDPGAECEDAPAEEEACGAGADGD